MKFCRSPLVKRLILCVLVMSLVVVAVPSPIRADETDLTSTAVTGKNVEKVENLAKYLKGENPKILTTGKATDQYGWNEHSLTWSTETKTKSWVYYNGIMMDAFLMLFDGKDDFRTIEDYVHAFYNNNNVSGGKPVSYAETELDSVPTARSLFDLIQSNSKTTAGKDVITSTQKDDYRKAIYWVYNSLLEYAKKTKVGKCCHRRSIIDLNRR